jgi:hypothetical protein
MTSSRLVQPSQSLDLQILDLEQRLLRRRRSIGSMAVSFEANARARTICSPRMLIAGVGLGVFLHRSTRRDGDRRAWPLVNLLNAAYAGCSLVSTITSWVGASPRVQPSADRVQPDG